MGSLFPGTIKHAPHWHRHAGQLLALSISGDPMRNRIFAIAAAAAFLSAPAASLAQNEVTTGVGRGNVIVNEGVEGIARDQMPAFREYVIRERIPNYAIPDRVGVGVVLPQNGVTYYDVPQSFGMTPYRYTVVNSRTVLVEPRTRRIVQIVE
jgi:hypothetical protein